MRKENIYNNTHNTKNSYQVLAILKIIYYEILRCNFFL